MEFAPKRQRESKLVKAPDLGQGEGQPGGPESKRSWNGRQIKVPEVIGVPGGDDARGALGSFPRSGLFVLMNSVAYYTATGLDLSC